MAFGIGETGICTALGADTGSVVWIVMREDLRLTAAGVAVGAGAAWRAPRLIQAQLFSIQTADLSAAALGIVAVAVLSGYFPAGRATSIDPVRALRWESPTLSSGSMQPFYCGQTA